MRIRKTIFGLTSVVLALVFAGCLISGTFVVTEDFSFTADQPFYHKTIDLSSNGTWKKHKDQINLIDAVGLDFTMTGADSTTFNVYAAPLGTDSTSIAGALAGGAFPILEYITFTPPSTHIDYAASLAHIVNLDKLKALVKAGSFEYYGTSSHPGGGFEVNGKIIITFSASGS